MMDENDNEESLKSNVRKRSIKSVFLLSILFVYLIFGAVVFAFLENETRKSRIEAAVEELEEERSELLKVLWASTMSTNEHDWTFNANERMDLYEKILQYYVKDNINVDYPDDTLNPWTFMGSLFYCFSVITTIGFGNIAPQTATGKVATIFYATFGIPLTLLVLSEVGKCLTLLLKGGIKKVQKNNKSDSSEEFNFGPKAALLLTFLYLFTGATIFSFVEGWNLLDSSYFCFVTFSTIGLGDVLPEHPNFMIFIMLYDFTALSMCSMCFYSVQRTVDVYLNQVMQNVEQSIHKLRKTRQLRRLSHIVGNGFTKNVKSPLKNSFGKKMRQRLLVSRFTEEEDEEEEESESA